MPTQTPAPVLAYDPVVTTTKPGKAALIVGWIFSIIPGLLFSSAIAMMFMPKMVTDGMVQQGFADPVRATWVVLILELTCGLLYLFPKTAVLGAVLLTGYCGGAIAIHLRMAEYAQMLPAIILGLMLWMGLFLREPRLRRLLPWRTKASNT